MTAVPALGDTLSGQDNTSPLGAFAFHVAFSTGLFANVTVTPDTAPESEGEGGAAPGNQEEETSEETAIDAPPPHTATSIIGGFSQVSGLEASMEPKTIRSGGDNYRTHQRIGAVSFGTVTLKRGIIRSRHLWGWWSLFTGADQTAGSEKNGLWNGITRPDVSIMLVQNNIVALGWKLEKALPVKFRIGDLDAASGEIAIEELHLAHQGLHRMLPTASGNEGGAS